MAARVVACCGNSALTPQAPVGTDEVTSLQLRLSQTPRDVATAATESIPASPCHVKLRSGSPHVRPNPTRGAKGSPRGTALVTCGGPRPGGARGAGCRRYLFGSPEPAGLGALSSLRCSSRTTKCHNLKQLSSAAFPPSCTSLQLSRAGHLQGGVPIAPGLYLCTCSWHDRPR